MTRATRLSCRTLAAAMCVTTVLSTLPAFAADLGVRGATWPVIEPDLLEEIEARLSTMQRSGEMARIEREARSAPAHGWKSRCRCRASRRPGKRAHACSTRRSSSNGTSALPTAR